MKKYYLLLSLLCLTSVLVVAKVTSKHPDKKIDIVPEQGVQEKIASPVDAKVTKKSEHDIYTVDSIKAVIFAPEGVEIITQSDIERPSLTGAQRTQEEIIFEKLVFLDAKKHKIIPDEDAVDKYLATVQKENHITLDELKAIFNSAGYSFEEGREQFKIMQAVNIMLDFKIRSNLIVPRKEIESYYEQHPEKKEARYQLEYAFISFDISKDIDVQLQEIEQLVVSSNIETDITWGDPFWVNKSDVAQDKQFIFDMQPGQVELKKGQAGFEVYRLKNKEEEQVRSLDERRLEIMDILRRPRYFQLLEEYKKILLGTAFISYF
ncbi:MAG: hypothetical protein Q8Q25_02195 [bacterium]|nr:hypothetical protein [bacterium]